MNVGSRTEGAYGRLLLYSISGKENGRVLPGSQSTEQGSEWRLEPCCQAHMMLLILKGVSFPGTHAAGFGASQLLSLSAVTVDIGSNSESWFPHMSVEQTPSLQGCMYVHAWWNIPDFSVNVA